MTASALVSLIGGPQDGEKVIAPCDRFEVWSHGPLCGPSNWRDGTGIWERRKRFEKDRPDLSDARSRYEIKECGSAHYIGPAT